jgi:hypothetical protein
MNNDRKQELERLEKELLADIPGDDDLLADIPIELLDTTPITWEDIDEDPILDSLEITPEDLMDYPQEPQEPVKPMKKTPSKKALNAKKREDRHLTVLMAIASFLCLGIIGVLIYWLEAFFQ